MNYEKYIVQKDFTVQLLPRVVRIETCASCNLKCIHCPTGNTNNHEVKFKNMSMDVFQRIVSEINSHSVDVIVLYHGGEPFLNKNIISIIKTFNDMKIPRIQLNTNGTLLTDVKIKAILNSGLTRIVFSIDGKSVYENNKIRRGSDCISVFSKIKKLLELKEKLGSSIPEVFIDNVQISEPDEVLLVNGPKIPDFLLNEFSKWKNCITFRSYYMSKWPDFQDNDKYNIVKIDTNERDPIICDDITETITFRWNGDVVPCCYDITSKYIIGNIMNDSLVKIWNNDKYKNLRESILKRKLLPLCQSCNAFSNKTFMCKKKSISLI